MAEYVNVEELQDYIYGELWRMRTHFNTDEIPEVSYRCLMDFISTLLEAAISNSTKIEGESNGRRKENS